MKVALIIVVSFLISPSVFANSILIDDMEDYDAINCPIDGPGGWRDFEYNTDPWGQCQIGTDIVNSGKQSLKFIYDNKNWYHRKYYTSETVKLFNVSQDWSDKTLLKILIHGKASNGPDRLYFALEDNTGRDFTIYHHDPNVLVTENWQLWLMPLRDFVGVDSSEITKIFLGIGTRHQTIGPPKQLEGSVYFDDLTVDQSGCYPEFAKPAGDLTNDCIVDLADLQLMAENWLCYNSLTIFGDEGIAGQKITNFKDFNFLAGNWLEKVQWP